jgi:serine/threonine protein kinase
LEELKELAKSFIFILAELQEKEKIAHRDIKPTNILYDDKE